MLKWLCRHNLNDREFLEDVYIENEVISNAGAYVDIDYKLTLIKISRCKKCGKLIKTIRKQTLKPSKMCYEELKQQAIECGYVSELESKYL